MALDGRTPPVANKLAHATMGALPLSTLQYCHRYRNKKILGDQRRFFYKPPPTKLAIALLSQSPCVTGASSTKNSKTPAPSRLASIFKLSQDAAHDDTPNHAALTATIKRPPQSTLPRRASTGWEPSTTNQPQRAIWSCYPTQSLPPKN